MEGMRWLRENRDREEIKPLFGTEDGQPTKEWLVGEKEIPKRL
jgi:hypothetical protein